MNKKQTQPIKNPSAAPELSGIMRVPNPSGIEYQVQQGKKFDRAVRAKKLGERVEGMVYGGAVATAASTPLERPSLTVGVGLATLGLLKAQSHLERIVDKAVDESPVNYQPPTPQDSPNTEPRIAH